MRRPHLLRRRQAGALAAAGVLALGVAVVLPAGSASAGPSSGAASGAAAVVSRGHAVAVGSSTPSAQPAPPAGVVRHALPYLRRPAVTGVARVAATGTAPSARTAPSGPASVMRQFDGVDAVDNLTAAGFDLEPPDEGLAAGNGYVVNFVNVTGQVQGLTGAVLARPFYLNTFFHETATADTSDPRVFYDASSGRWIATILGYSFAPSGLVQESHVDVAVSAGGDPRAAWRVVRFDTSNPSHAGCPCLADYPILGVDHDNVYVSTNEFTGALDAFNGAQLYAISKGQLAAGAAHPAMVLFSDLSVAGTLGYHVQPANTYGDPGVEYLMSSLDPNAGFDNRIAVWAVTDPAAVSTGGLPALSVRTVSSEAYGPPPNAETPPGFCTGVALCGKDGAATSGTVSANDDAMQEVQYINGRLVGALDTGVTLAGESGRRAGIAWFVVRPQVAGGQVATGTQVERQGYLAQRGEYLLFPHINMTQNGAMAMTFGFGGPSTYMSAAYSTALPGGTFSTVRIAAAGVTSDNGFTATDAFGGVGRWGDYSNGQIIPGTDKVWLATQYIPNTGTGSANWGSRILELWLG